MHDYKAQKEISNVSLISEGSDSCFRLNAIISAPLLLILLVVLTVSDSQFFSDTISALGIHQLSDSRNSIRNLFIPHICPFCVSNVCNDILPRLKKVGSY